MADYFNKKQKNGMGSLWDDEKESTADILYPTMRNIKPKTSSFTDVLSGNSYSKKSSSTLLGASDFDDEPEFRKYKVDFDNSDTGKADLRRVESNGVSELDNVRASATTGQRPAGATGSRESKSKTEDWIAKQIKDEDERIAKLKRTADILYGKTTPEHGIYWKRDTDNSSSVEKDNNIDETKTNTSSKISDVDDDEEDILDLFYPTMKNLKSKNKTSSLRDEIKSQTSPDSEKLFGDKNDNQPTSEIKDETKEKVTSSDLPKFAPEKEETRKTTAKNEKTEFDSGMKIPDFAENFDEDFDTDETDDEPGNKIEEQENDFPSEISNKKKKSDKDGIVTGGAARIKKSHKTNILKKLGMDDNEYQVHENTISRRERLNDYEVINGIKYPRNTKAQKVQEMKNEALKQRDLENKTARENYLKKSNSKLYQIGVDKVDNPVIKASESFLWKEATENLHMSKKGSYMNTEYAKKHKVYNNYKESPKELQEYLKEKISKQIGENELETTKGIYIDKESETSKNLAEALKKDAGFKGKLKEYEKALKDNYYVDDSISLENDNWNKALGNADIKKMHINKNGDIELYITDTYDFNKNEKSGLPAIGRDRQEKGEIIPYFIIYHVLINKKDIDTN